MSRAELSEKIRALRGDDAIRFIGWMANAIADNQDNLDVVEESADFIEWLEAQPKKQD